MRSNPFSERLAESLQSLARSALPAAVNWTGMLQQPRPFHPLVNRPCDIPEIPGFPAL